MHRKTRIIIVISVIPLIIGIVLIPKQKEEKLQNTQIAMYYTDNGNQIIGFL